MWVRVEDSLCQYQIYQALAAFSSTEKKTQGIGEQCEHPFYSSEKSFLMSGRTVPHVRETLMGQGWEAPHTHTHHHHTTPLVIETILIRQTVTTFMSASLLYKANFLKSQEASTRSIMGTSIASNLVCTLGYSENSPVILVWSCIT